MRNLQRVSELPLPARAQCQNRLRRHCSSFAREKLTDAAAAAAGANAPLSATAHGTIRRIQLLVANEG